MKLFDLHCDTALELERGNFDLYDNEELHISLKQASVFSEYRQVFAVWSEHRLSAEEAWERFLAVRDDFKKRLKEIDAPWFHPILGVEDSVILNGKSERLDVLYESGVRVLTLGWADTNSVCGSWNTEEGLTDFGKEIVRRCFELGILPDLSHASDRTFYDTAAIAEEVGKPIIASHSVCRALRTHGRNMTDDMLKTLFRTGGIVGANLVCGFITDKSYASLEDVVRHMMHAYRLGGEDRVCLGCDLDGTGSLPGVMKGIGDLPMLYDAICKFTHSERIAEKIFYSNARNFFSHWIHS